MNPFRDHAKIRYEFLADDSTDNAERYFESADAMDRLRTRLNVVAFVAVSVLAIASAAYNLKTRFDGGEISLLEYGFPLLAIALSSALFRIIKDLDSRGTREVVAVANRAKFINDLRRNNTSNH